MSQFPHTGMWRLHPVSLRRTFLKFHYLNKLMRINSMRTWYSMLSHCRHPQATVWIQNRCVNRENELKFYRVVASKLFVACSAYVLSEGGDHSRSQRNVWMKHVAYWENFLTVAHQLFSSCAWWRRRKRKERKMSKTVIFTFGFLNPEKGWRNLLSGFSSTKQKNVVCKFFVLHETAPVPDMVNLPHPCT